MYAPVCVCALVHLPLFIFIFLNIAPQLRQQAAAQPTDTDVLEGRAGDIKKHAVQK